ncbi:MAG: formyltetrahydrofolate deformylase [Candidatus Omnitrophota bacterium]
MAHAILLISCSDRKGITAAVTGFISEHNGNIIHADQHIDEQSNTFFMRVEWDLREFDIVREDLPASFSHVSEPFGMDWQLFFTDEISRLAVFVSGRTHCLYDLLLKYRSGHLPCEIPLVISNHEHPGDIAREFGIDFRCFPKTPENKKQQEQQEIALLNENGIDLVALARYHQIFSPEFVEAFPQKIINIHHSFLPAFPGREPYARAYERGVKIIGATSHFVTAELDQGPIIEQDIVRVSHRDTVEDLIRKGEDLERLVFSRAVRWALERKILSYGNKTVVFD